MANDGFATEISRILVSPLSGEPLRPHNGRLIAAGDSHTYGYNAAGQLDLRLPAPKTVQLDFTLGRTYRPEAAPEMLRANPAPEVDFSGVDIPTNVNAETLSYFPRAGTAGELALDLGCGAGNYRPLLERAGYTYIGVDVADPAAPILADAQALPFADDSIGFVWSGAMLQYVPFAFPAIREQARVLKSGGLFIGTVGFLEAFDGHSQYMYTKSGLLNLLDYGGFEISLIAPDAWWTGPTAIVSMGLFPRLPHTVSRVMVWPLETMSKLWWRVAALKNPRLTELSRLTKTTGGFVFVARKR